VLSDPFGAVAQLRRVLPNVVGAVVADSTPASLTADLRLAPPLELKPAGYPIEPIRIVIETSHDEPRAYPLRPGLRWLHRNADLTTVDGYGSLCLWYPRDPRRLRWVWNDGFEQFVAIVHRHLIGEEWWRREGRWPWRDAPHGEPANGRPHPVPTRRQS
jgi:hypothetical protein